MRNYFIQTFNPIKWFEAGNTPEDFERELKKFYRNEEVILQWSVQSHRQATVGDISFFLVQGVEPRGIFGAGIIDSEPFPDPNWNGNGRTVHYVDVSVKKYTHYAKPFISLNELKRLDPTYNWSPRSGGIPLPPATGMMLMEKLNWKI